MHSPNKYDDYIYIYIYTYLTYIYIYIHTYTFISVNPAPTANQTPKNTRSVLGPSYRHHLRSRGYWGPILPNGAIAPPRDCHRVYYMEALSVGGPKAEERAEDLG